MELLEALALAFGGALLLTPGFVTDAVGFACLIPTTRRALLRRLVARFTIVTPAERRDGGRVIEGEWRRGDEP
jgi:UPF0716 protein FxsA